LNRHPPDAGLAEAEIAAFDGFWQRETLDMGLSLTQTGDIGTSRAGSGLNSPIFRTIDGAKILSASNIRRLQTGGIARKTGAIARKSVTALGCAGRRLKIRRVRLQAD
jgi:hypothetical protein